MGRYDGFKVLVDNTQAILESALVLFRDNLNWQGRTGGYFCHADPETGLPYLISSSGDVLPEKAEKYLRLCQEKARRLASHPEHLSSWESRSLELEQYGGAVRIGESIFSFSGLPELGDEALTLIVGGIFYTSHVNYFPPVMHLIRTIASRSNNPYFSPLFRAACTVSGHESFLERPRTLVRG